MKHSEHDPTAPPGPQAAAKPKAHPAETEAERKAEPDPHAPGSQPEETPEAQDEAAAPDLAGELAETKDRLLRALADIENLRRRTARELDEARKYAVTGFAREMLEIDDNLSRALESIPASAGQEVGFVKNLAEGVAMTQKALEACFERHHIAKVTPQIGDKFDHNRHQAMFEVEGDQPPGTIAQVLQPGYVIADRLLRPAMVGVAKARPAAAEPKASPPEEPL
ncbi:MAG: nucleotide exchange factor GrpE, partial [Pseudomonadota bacterium]